MVLGIFFIILYARIAYWRRSLEGARKRSRVAADLMNADKSSPEFLDIVKEAFEAYDLDQSGTLDLAEARKLFRAMFAKMPQHEFAKLMIMAKAFTSADGTMELEAFTDASAHILQARRPPRARSSAPPSARSRLTLERWL